MYLHFDDIQSLVLAVADRRFGELVQLQEDARNQDADPCQQVRAGCLAYCEFGLMYQGHYQVMFTTPLPLPEDMTPEQFPGRKAFQQLVEAIAACIGVDPEDQRASFTAQLIWQQLHGIVSLRISRPRFPVAPAGRDGHRSRRPPPRRRPGSVTASGYSSRCARFRRLPSCMACTRATGMARPSATSSSLSGCGAGSWPAHAGRPASRPGTVCTVKSPGVMSSRSSHGTGNETRAPGLTRGL